jgi:hypothetical protein
LSLFMQLDDPGMVRYVLHSVPTLI